MPKVSPEHMKARRNEILEAAMECFSRRGFHRTSMKDIIEESGLSAGAIYNHFSSKNEIVDEIARERHARENTLLMSAVGASDKALDLQALARSFFTGFAAKKHRNMRRVGVEVWAEALWNPDVMKTVRRGVDEPVKLLARIVTECQQRDELPPHVDPEGLARVMVAVFQGFVLQQAWDPKIDTERYLGAVDTLLDALSA